MKFVRWVVGLALTGCVFSALVATFLFMVTHPGDECLLFVRWNGIWVRSTTMHDGPVKNNNNLWLKHYQYFRKWKIIILRSFCSVRGEALIYGHPAGCRFISTAHIMVKPHHQHHLRQPSLSSSKWLSSRDLIISIISIIVSIVLGPLIVNICFPLSFVVGLYWIFQQVDWALDDFCLTLLIAQVIIATFAFGLTLTCCTQR